MLLGPRFVLQCELVLTFFIPLSSPMGSRSRSVSAALSPTPDGMAAVASGKPQRVTPDVRRQQRSPSPSPAEPHGRLVVLPERRAELRSVVEEDADAKDMDGRATKGAAVRNRDEADEEDERYAPNGVQLPALGSGLGSSMRAVLVVKMLASLLGAVASRLCGA